MEPIRPQLDAYLLDWITREPLRREWFFEERDGNCRLMGPFAVRLAETASTWARAIAPIAERVARTLWATIPRPSKRLWPATRLTQGHRREAKGRPANPPAQAPPPPPEVCRTCGGAIAPGSMNCLRCTRMAAKKTFVEIARLGQMATHSPKAEAQRGRTQRRQRAAQKAWDPSDKPGWLDEKTYREEVQPRLAKITVSAISSALGVSQPYASGIRAGKRQPHQRHWVTLARLGGVLSDK